MTFKISLLILGLMLLTLLGHEATPLPVGQKLSIPKGYKAVAITYWSISLPTGKNLVSMPLTSEMSQSIIDVLENGKVVLSPQRRTPSDAKTSLYARRIITFVNDLSLPMALTIEGAFVYDHDGYAFEPSVMDQTPMIMDEVDAVIEKFKH